MRKLLPGWYIMLYHDVSWEENCYIRSIGGTCPPDVFREHVRIVSGLGELVTVTEGERRLREDRLNTAVFSFWFDDGLAGVAKYAMPILSEFGVTGAISICSRFVVRKEFFWRYKLSYLNSIDGLRFLRPHLRKQGFSSRDSVRFFTLDNFSIEILSRIDEVFVRFTTPAQRADAYRMFLDREGIKSLASQDWTITNHTAGHYVISQDKNLPLLRDEFQECETEIESLCARPSDYWVLPFDRESSPDVIATADRFRGDRYIVFVGNRRNTRETCGNARVLYRIDAPFWTHVGLLKTIQRAG